MHRSNIVGSGLARLFHPVVTTRNTTYLSNPIRYKAEPSWRGYWVLAPMSKINQGQPMIFYV